MIVKIGFDVQEIFAISEVNMDYQMTVYFRQTWRGVLQVNFQFKTKIITDPRLALQMVNCSLNLGMCFTKLDWVQSSCLGLPA